MAQKRAMAGQNIPLARKFRNGWQIFLEHRRAAWGGAHAYVERYRLLHDLLKEHMGKPVDSCRVLEVGCGQRAVMPLVFAAKGAEAHGIDVEVPTFRMNPSVFTRVLKINGADRAFKSLARHVLFDRKFFTALQKAFDLTSLPLDKIKIKVLDAAELDYPDDYFDLIFSFAAFEHITEVESAVEHINRTLTTDGIAVIHIHLFASLSGGHCMEWQRPDAEPSNTVPPWDHLRENKYPANTYLNKLRIKDYEGIFHKLTSPRRVTYGREGVGLTHLIPESLLETYTIEELTTNSVQYLVAKKM